jgi:molecular chaperone GrpE (heat shock protein)
MTQMRTRQMILAPTILVEEKRPLPSRQMRLLALFTRFSETGVVENPLNHLKIPKWPFVLGQVLLLGLAYLIVWRSPHPISKGEIVACFAAAFAGALIGILPFLIDYKLMGKKIEGEALGSVAEKIQGLERLAGQVASATNEWTNVQNQAEKTSQGAKEIAQRMAEEVRQFSDFMQKMNDGEKAALRLETEKFRRAEGEWLQVLVRILDHIFLLHSAATRSGQPQLAQQIASFQNACRDVARRIGLASFVAAPDEPFNPERYQVVGDAKPAADAVIAETVGAGYTFQGKMLRPALVKLREANVPAEEPASTGPAPADENPEEGQLPLPSE